MSRGTAVATRGLGKRYGDVVAVEGLDLDVREGEIYAFLGRNGAGKTTTIRMLLGLVRPTAGQVRILGSPMTARSSDVLGRVGFLVETATAYANLTVLENLEIQRRLTGAARGAMTEAVERLGLTRYAERRAGALSLGNRQRLGLARALLHRPSVLLLDEPANALDPAGIVEVRELLRSLSTEEGVTVFMSSHILAEVAQVADRIGIVHEGHLTEELDREELRARARPFLEVRAGNRTEARRTLIEAGFSAIEEAESGLRVFGDADRASDIARVLVRGGVELTALIPAQEDLESYFLRRTGGTA